MQNAKYCQLLVWALSPVHADVMTPLEGRLAQPGFMNPVLALKAARLGDRALHSGRIGDLLPLAPRRVSQTRTPSMRPRYVNLSRPDGALGKQWLI